MTPAPTPGEPAEDSTKPYGLLKADPLRLPVDRDTFSAPHPPEPSGVRDVVVELLGLGKVAGVVVESLGRVERPDLSPGREVLVAEPSAGLVPGGGDEGAKVV